jgi:hypothetical protein
MGKVILFEATIAPVPEGIDAVTQELDVTFSADESDVIVAAEHLTLDGGVVPFELPVGVFAKAALVYADAAGNKSQEPALVEWEVIDDVAPPTPEGFTIASVGERVDPDPAPEPEPEPEV